MPVQVTLDGQYLPEEKTALNVAATAVAVHVHPLVEALPVVDAPCQRPLGHPLPSSSKASSSSPRIASGSLPTLARRRRVACRPVLQVEWFPRLPVRIASCRSY